MYAKKLEYKGVDNVLYIFTLCFLVDDKPMNIRFTYQDGRIKKHEIVDRPAGMQYFLYGELHDQYIIECADRVYSSLTSTIC